MEFKDSKVNTIINKNNCSKELWQLLLNIGSKEGKCFTEGHNFYISKNENSCMGLRVIKDYYKTIELVFNTEFGINSINICNLYNTGDEGFMPDLGRYIKDKKLCEKLEKELKELFKSDFKVLIDYDYMNIMDAINTGDFGLVDDICGDRDIFELILVILD